jgi:hypothetical protein
MGSLNIIQFNNGKGAGAFYILGPRWKDNGLIPINNRLIKGNPRYYYLILTLSTQSFAVINKTSLFSLKAQFEVCLL